MDGRVEYIGGRLLYMPPCADVQQDVVPSVVHAVYGWAEAHGEFVVASNEAGMILGGEVRGADVAVWRRADAEPRTGHYRTRPPLLAVEVAGQDEGENELRAKARWYLDNAVELVWIVLPETHEVIVIRAGAESRHGAGARLPETALLPGLAPEVSRFFSQIDGI